MDCLQMEVDSFKMLFDLNFFFSSWLEDSLFSKGDFYSDPFLGPRD